MIFRLLGIASPFLRVPEDILTIAHTNPIVIAEAPTRDLLKLQEPKALPSLAQQSTLQPHSGPLWKL